MSRMHIFQILSGVIILISTNSDIYGQRLSAGTNLLGYADLCTFNAEISVGVANKITVHGNIDYNPHSFNRFQSRKKSYSIGIRYWPWHIYSGWFMGSRFKTIEYNIGGFKTNTAQEGDIYGAGVNIGYSFMLSKRFNLEIGIGGMGGVNSYVTYSKLEKGILMNNEKRFIIIPDNILIQIVFTI